jgi:hypothetical protein
MSSGFFVVFIVASLLVVIPSLIANRAWWRRGGFWRALPIISAVWVAVLAAVLLHPSERPNSYEERIVLLLVAWGVGFYLLAAVALVVELAKNAIKGPGSST